MSDQNTTDASGATPNLSGVALNDLLAEVRSRVCAVTVWVEQDAIDEGFDPETMSWKHVEEACTRAGFEAMDAIGDPLDDEDDEDDEATEEA